jgi:protocatechuate 3,4-dioxygenase beta subunit
MQQLCGVLIVLAILNAAPPLARGQSAGSDEKAIASAGGSISGNVALDGKPAAGVKLVLISKDQRTARMVGAGNEGDVKAQCVSNAEGHYRFDNVSAGDYSVIPFDPILTVPAENANPLGRGTYVSMANGDSIDGVNFNLTRGAVITGRVTRQDGKPAIEAGIDIQVAGDPSAILLDPVTGEMGRRAITDDRGIYRVFGLAPGRYKVSGSASWTGAERPVFYPGVTDPGQAGIVTLSAAQEAANIDIQLSTGKKYEAVGSVVDDNANPIPNASCAYSSLPDDQQGGHSYGGFETTDAKGQFRLQNLVPGRYSVAVIPNEQSDLVGNPVAFSIDSADLSGIRITVHHGASLSGVVVIAGGDDSQAQPQLSQLQIYVSSVDSTGNATVTRWVSPAPDGTFQVTGLVAGRVTFQLDCQNNPPGFAISGVERDGVPQPSGLTISEGEQVTGVLLVLNYGTGVLAGQVVVRGGAPPAGAMMFVSARGVSSAPGVVFRSAQVDARGRFEITGLPDGQYTLGVGYSNGRISGSQQNGQSVTVAGGQAPETTIVFDLSKMR